MLLYPPDFYRGQWAMTIFTTRKMGGIVFYISPMEASLPRPFNLVVHIRGVLAFRSEVVL